jgi:hypothetical protein
VMYLAKSRQNCVLGCRSSGSPFSTIMEYCCVSALVLGWKVPRLVGCCCRRLGRLISRSVGTLLSWVCGAAPAAHLIWEGFLTVAPWCVLASAAKFPQVFCKNYIVYCY